LAEPGFDAGAFEARLRTDRLGRVLLAHAEVESTNDAAWESLAGGRPDGAVIVADVQRRGRGRAGRTWHTSPGRGLALSVLLRAEGAPRAPGLLPLAAGLALARGLEVLGARAALKWPNDLLIAGRKVAGILCESRGPAATVVGVGVNVAQSPADFPPEIALSATSLAMEGCSASREVVAAEFLNALEPLRAELLAGAGERVLEAWRARAGFWGRPVRVRTPGGPARGVARGVTSDGALLLEREDGGTIAVLAGDLETEGVEEGERP
jgi:BirA family biotin operon repressor/biotin-[acetyl-CoA-carboxylase] ligase